MRSVRLMVLVLALVLVVFAFAWFADGNAAGGAAPDLGALPARTPPPSLLDLNLDKTTVEIRCAPGFVPIGSRDSPPACSLPRNSVVTVSDPSQADGPDYEFEISGGRLLGS